MKAKSSMFDFCSKLSYTGDLCRQFFWIEILLFVSDFDYLVNALWFYILAFQSFELDRNLMKVIPEN
jgi:hypothetical protein